MNIFRKLEKEIKDKEKELQRCCIFGRDIKDYSNVDEVIKFCEGVMTERNAIEYDLAYNDNIIDFQCLIDTMSGRALANWLQNNHYEEWKICDFDDDYIDCSSLYFDTWRTFSINRYGHEPYSSLEFEQFLEDMVDDAKELNRAYRLLEKVMAAEYERDQAESIVEIYFNNKNIDESNIIQELEAEYNRQKEQSELENEKYL